MNKTGPVLIVALMLALCSVCYLIIEDDEDSHDEIVDDLEEYGGKVYYINSDKYFSSYYSVQKGSDVSYEDGNLIFRENGMITWVIPWDSILFIEVKKSYY